MVKITGKTVVIQEITLMIIESGCTRDLIISTQEIIYSSEVSEVK